MASKWRRRAVLISLVAGIGVALPLVALLRIDGILAYAVRHGNENVVRVLIALGTEVSAKGRDGFTPLHHAAGWGERDVVEAVLAAVPYVDVRDDRGATPLHEAAQWGQAGTVAALTEAGADVNAKTHLGVTPLMMAAGTNVHSSARPPANYAATLQILLGAGADMNARDSRGMTAMACAEMMRRTENIALLREYALLDSADGSETQTTRNIPRDFRVLAGRTISAFSLEMYRKIETRNRNLVFSPFSIFVPLAIAFEGARGLTGQEMAQVLRIDETPVPIHATISALTRRLKASMASDNGTLEIANGLWVHRFKDYALRDQFLKTIRSHYDIMIRYGDFESSPDKMVQEINSWVGDVTRGRIRRLTSVEEMTRTPWVMSIVNAVYFLRSWADPFNARHTTDEYFTLPDGSRILVPMMQKTSRNCRYMEESAFQVLEIPYRGWAVSMVVFLPRETDGLTEFEQSLTAENLRWWLRELHTWEPGVKVSLPKFTLRCRHELVPTLKSMGMKMAFVPKQADFSGLLQKTNPRVPDESLFISAVQHEAWIAVDEKGTEAAAATNVAISKLMPRNKPKVFRADHPFMFIIYHKPTNCILFMGRVTRPQ